MAIENRNLEVGTRLVASYKKQRHVCTVEAAEDGQGVSFKLEEGKTFKSLSSAGSAVMGGKAVNGWKFWSLEAEVTEAHVATKPSRTKKAKGKGLISRVPNRPGVSEEKSSWFCTACMKSFVVDGETQPLACPEGHRPDDQDPASLATLEVATVEVAANANEGDDADRA